MLKKISMKAAQDKKMFGPVYHGTSETARQAIEKEGFKIHLGDSREGDIANGYEGGVDYHDGKPPPVHHMGYGVYFTTSKSIAKQYNKGSLKGLKMYYLDVSRLETINFGASNTMMKWWVQNGYSMPRVYGTHEHFSRDEISRMRVKATQALTDKLKEKYDAVWFKGKGFKGRLLDGDQIVVFDPERIYEIDPTQAGEFEVGSKVKRKADGMIGVIHEVKDAKALLEKAPGASTWLKPETKFIFQVKWTKGGMGYNVQDIDVEPYKGRSLKQSVESTYSLVTLPPPLLSLAQVAVKKTRAKPKTKTLKKLVEPSDSIIETTPDDHIIMWKDIKTAYPEIAEQLKGLFLGKDRIKVGDLKQHIQSYEPTDENFWISFDTWNGMQRDLNLPQLVVQLNISKPLQQAIRKDPIASEFFEDYYKLLQGSMHPAHNQTLAWARVYDLVTPNVFVVEEIQSDLFGASTRLKDSANEAIDHILNEYDEEQKKKLENFFHEHFVDWDKKLLATVIQIARQNGKEGVWIFDEDYKQKYLQSPSKAKRYYKVVPRDLGFTRTTFEYKNQKIPAWHRVVASFSEYLTAKYEG